LPSTFSHSLGQLRHFALQKDSVLFAAGWESIAPKQLIAGYSELVQREIDLEGSNAFLLTFMFKPLSSRNVPRRHHHVFCDFSGRQISHVISNGAMAPRTLPRRQHRVFSKLSTSAEYCARIIR
jgi:hypothetical protein